MSSSNVGAEVEHEEQQQQEEEGIEIPPVALPALVITGADGATVRDDPTEQSEGGAPSHVTETTAHSTGGNLSAFSRGNHSEMVATIEASALVTEELLQLAEATRTIVPKGTWQSLGSEEEIANENAVGVQRRPPLRVQFDVSRSVLLRHRAAHTSFITKDASEDCRDLRPTQNPLYEVQREEVDVAVQAVPKKRVATTQTGFARQVCAAVQAQPTLVDACIRHMDVPAKENPKLSAFLKSSLPRMLHCLTQSFAVPIYTDDFALFAEDDAIVAARDDMLLLEKGNYAHTTTKDRRITSVGWRSGRLRDDFVCVASMAHHTLEERMEQQRRCDSSVSLVWQFSDPMHPRYLLESPEEIQVLRFCPSRPNLIAGGAVNGQVYLWDLAEADRHPMMAAADLGGDRRGVGGGGAVKGGAQGAGGTAVSDRARTGHGGGEAFAADIPEVPDSVRRVTVEKDGDVLVPRLQPMQASRVELSHRRPVHDLQWLPPNLECQFDGKQTAVEASCQFATVSDDSTMLVWDIRPEFLPPDKLRKMKHQTKTGGQDAVWVPMLKYLLSKPDGSGDLRAFRLFFDGFMPDESPSYTVAVGTTSGDLVTCQLVTKHDRHASLVVPAFGLTRETRCVRQVVPSAHAGPVFTVQRHPLIGDVYLTCGDHSFAVWRTGVDMPLYRSPYLESTVTCAAWSPARAALVFVGTGDGRIEAWDLLDRNNEPLLVHHMVQDAITTLMFKPLPSTQRLPSNFTQHVAMGTNLGSFHWYVLPAALSKPSTGEKRQFRAMLEREVRRVAFYTWRWTERQQELDRYGTAAPKMVLGGAAGGSVKRHGTADAADEAAGDDEDEEGRNFYGHDPQRDAEFLELVEQMRLRVEQEMRVDAVV